jgi:O-antigen/teichoic acid export membrane protein
LCLSLFVQAPLLEWFFQGKEQMYVIGAGRFASALVYFLLTIMFVHSSADLLRVAFAAVAGDVLATTLLLALYHKQLPESRLRFSIAGGKTLLSQTVPLGAGSILAHFSVNLPPIVIGIVMTNTDAGLYSAASKMVFFLLMFDRVLGTLLLPASARLFTLDPEALAERLNTALRWILIAALPLCVGGALLADQVIVFLFGSQYQPAAIVLQVLVWYMLFTMIHTVYTSGIIAVGKEKEYSRVMMMSAALYAVSILICTKLFGLVGASAAVVGSEAMTLVLMRRAFHNTMKTIVPRSLPMILVAVAAMAAVLFVLPSLHIIVTILIGAVVYGAVLFITRTLSAADFLLLVKRA